MTLKLETYNTCQTSLHMGTIGEAESKTRDWYISYPKRNVYLHVRSGEFIFHLRKDKPDVTIDNFIAGDVDYVAIRNRLGLTKEMTAKEVGISAETLREIEAGRWHNSKHIRFTKWETLFKLYQYYFN